MNWAVAYLVLFGTCNPSPEFFEYRAEIVATALQLQILDEREIRFTFVEPGVDFVNDVLMIRRRIADLGDTPLLPARGQTCPQLPTMASANDALAFNRAYRMKLDKILMFDHIHQDELRAAIASTDRLYQVYDCVRDIQCEYYYVSAKRISLKRLIELIGWDDFLDGRLPPCVPIWLFSDGCN